MKFLKYFQALGTYCALLLVASPAFAAFPDEGVYYIGEPPVKVIIDYTDPTGSAYVEYNASSAPQANGTAFLSDANMIAKPSTADLTLNITAHDNFELEGSFDRWDIERREGTPQGTPWSSCGSLGAYLSKGSGGFDYTITAPNTNNSYGDHMQITDSTTQVGKCYQYKLTAVDLAGNALTPPDETKFVYVEDPSTAPRVSFPTLENGSGPISFLSSCSTGSGTCYSEWSQSPITAGWDISDAETGILSATLSITYNGTTIPGYDNRDILGELNSSFSTSQGEGVYVLTFTITDASGNTTTKIIELQYDATTPQAINTSDLNNPLSTGTGVMGVLGANRSELFPGIVKAGDPTPITFVVDDRGSSPINSYVGGVHSSNITVLVKRCTDSGGMAGNCTGWEDAPADWYSFNTNSADGYADFDSNIGANGAAAANNTVLQGITFNHSRYFSYGGKQFQGDYKIILTIEQDQAGNGPVSHSIEVSTVPGDIDPNKSSVGLTDSCSDGTWKSSALISNGCAVSMTILDTNDNPVYGKSIMLTGASQTFLDQIHDNGEAVSFDNQTSAESIINNFISNPSNNSGVASVPLKAYAPGNGNLQFVAKYENHSSASFGSNSTNPADYNQDLTTLDPTTPDFGPYPYQVVSAYSITAFSGPSDFMKGTDLGFEVKIEKNANVTDWIAIEDGKDIKSRFGIFIADKASNKFDKQAFINQPVSKTQLSPSSDNGESSIQNKQLKSTWLQTWGWNDDDSVVYIGGNGDVSGSEITHKFKLRFDKKPGILLDGTDTEALIKPFFRFNLEGKQVVYIPKDASDSEWEISGNILLQSTALTGGGLSQATGAEAAIAGDAASQSVGSVNIKVFNARVKQKVKQEILDVAEATADGLIASDWTLSGDIERINNGRTYIVKGKDLIINGDLTINRTEPLAFISYGGNILIKGNIRYNAASTVKPTIAFIALQNEKTKDGGEIHIYNKTSSGDPLTHIAGALIAERGMMAADGSASNEFSIAKRTSDFQNQLVIEGSVMGPNTMGGSEGATKRCPSFIQAVKCDSSKAEKYDINLLRSYRPSGTGLKDTGESSDLPIVINYYLNKELIPDELSD